ncbi:uncharacterized protein TRAVEDRAFT_44370 [Trametes versicolor FP-101664 SS1]|uniref:uncharacterized protein n=1 Tax=Trametes versicolor (strain FP-101664) TaxID=717944 RepID=UPI00046229F3|nr:uncharacterized protein TRAVEDRAFT_44370 [Trametes versicolor FP-101664 SS1]EIW61548.1 hypothetical protein TRAVEDRAFT_44370 [Trametes versicolor FP-101664 SS1]
MSTAPRFYIALLNGEVLNSQQVDFPYRFQCILSHPYLIRGLGCVVATVDQLEFLRPLLTQQMPCLELLDIRVKQCTGPESVCLGGPMLDLSTARLMAVKRLRLDGIAVDMAAPFLCGLRHLTLNQFPGIERRLPLSQFVASISNFRRLETLELRNYSGFLVTKTTQPVDPVHLPSLKKLGICDTPSVTASLLQALYLPADAILHVIVDIKGFYPDDLGDLFSSALPADKKTLPILKDIRRVDVNLIGSTFSLIGMTLEGAKITLEIDLDLEFTLGLIARDHVYEATVRSLDRIFADSPLCYIGLSGNLACLTAHSWRAAFAPFPDLERLKLEDVGKHSAGALSLLEVLGSPAGTPAQMPCPKLDTLCMRGSAYGFELLDESEACLTRRQTATGTMLRRLWLGLGLHVQDDKARLQLCRKTLAQMVEIFTIQPVTC